MFREFIKSIYYFLYQFFFSDFLILSFFPLKKILIINKKKKNYFFQFIRDKNDLNTFRQIFIKEEYNFKNEINKLIYVNYLKIINNNKIPLIVDCGANICASSNYFNIIFPSSTVVAIEPDEINSKLFNKNNINKDKVKLIKCAISSENFYYDTIRKDNDGRSSYIKEKINAGPYDENLNKTITIPEILKKHKKSIYEPLLVKIDIEGHEKKLFQSNTKWIKLFKYLIIELHDWMIPDENISSEFKKVVSKQLSKYDVYTFGENTLVINRSKS
tara:strand:+ start:3842 stop:4660 length:819 start_codon:yes stop_codon:yes gene_type:complete